MNSTHVSVNICGFGFVGGSMGYLCEQSNVEFNVYDLSKKEGNFNYFDNISELVKCSESKNNINYYFICVPTPSDSEGNCNTTIVESVVRDLSNTITKKSIILVKSTVKPGTTRELSNKYQTDNVRIVFCPEFLREKTCKDDVYNTNFTLFGCGYSQSSTNVNVDVDDMNVDMTDMNDDMTDLKNNLKDLFVNYLYKHKDTFQCIFKSFEECELFKYTLNTYFGMKILFFNEIFELCESFNVDYQELKSLFPLDSRIGSYGVNVPGYDGKKGYGLSCLPKEIRGMKKLRES